MTDIAPILSDAIRLVRGDMFDIIDYSEFLALQTAEWTDTDAEQARALIVDLVNALRRLVAEHNATDTGDCPICHEAWPCPVVGTLHRTLNDPDNEFVQVRDRLRD